MIVLCFVIKKKRRGPEPVTLQSVELTVVAGATRSPPIPIPQELSDAEETAEQVLDNASGLHHHHDNVAASRDALRKAQLKRAAKAVAASEVNVTGKSAEGAAKSAEVDKTEEAVEAKAAQTSAGENLAKGFAASGFGSAAASATTVRHTSNPIHSHEEIAHSHGLRAHEAISTGRETEGRGDIDDPLEDSTSSTTSSTASSNRFGLIAFRFSFLLSRIFSCS